MGRCYYRCNRCRTRNTFDHPVYSYKRAKSCRGCGHKKFYVDKERRDRPVCKCPGGYFWGSHRPGSPCCDLNPMVDYNRAVRAGTHPGELAWDGHWCKVYTGEGVPF